MIRHITPGLRIGVLAALAALAPEVGLADIGSVAAINGKMRGTPPSKGVRALGLGDAVYSNELIQTGTDGLGQFLFIDNTSLTVGKNSRIVLDRYVFDPDKGRGQIALSMTRGALRFVGGAISKTETVTIRTPAGSIGIRGGMAMIELRRCELPATCEVKVTNIASQFVVVGRYGDSDGDGLDDGPASGKGPSSSLTLTRPGATASGGVGGVEYTGLATSGDLQSSYEAMESGGDGGLGKTVSREAIDAATSALTAGNSGQRGATNNAPVATDGSTGGTGSSPYASRGPSATEVGNTGGTRLSNSVNETGSLPPGVIDGGGGGGPPPPF